MLCVAAIWKNFDGIWILRPLLDNISMVCWLLNHCAPVLALATQCSQYINTVNMHHLSFFEVQQPQGGTAMVVGQPVVGQAVMAQPVMAQPVMAQPCPA